jgi:mannose/cellobiose epimerase-like protein (N-acyl-D-glucosamine 2-epimerase family)
MTLHYFESDKSPYFVLATTLNYLQFFVLFALLRSVLCCGDRAREMMEVEHLLNYHFHQLEMILLISPVHELI